MDATQELFSLYQKKLDARNDKFERLVKLSRDITIESKRLIFQLHRGDNGSDNDNIIHKFSSLKKYKWQHVSKELEGESGYQFLKAYSPGLQEYIEALAFHHYLKTGELISLKDIEDDLTFSSNFGNVPETNDESDSKRGVLVPPEEYFLGIADFSGELMRFCISSATKSGFEACEKICYFLRCLFEGFGNLNGLPRDLARKVGVLKQSLLKVENALYTIKLRGSEIPKEHLIFAITDNSYKNVESENCEEEFY